MRGSRSTTVVRIVAIVLLFTGFEGTSLSAVPGAAAQAAIDCSQYADVPVGVAAGTPEAATPQLATSVPFPEEGGELVVFAAASLTDAFTEIGDQIEAQNPNVTVTLNFAGSQALVTQLSEGAQADVFAAANMDQMVLAQEAGVIAGEPVVFAQNRLTIVVPSDNPAGITSPADLAKDGVILVLAQQDVPVGRYARASICALAQDPTLPEDFVERVAANITSQEEDVRGVLTRVQLGEADAGMVYTTDAMSAGDAVTQIEIPAAANVDTVYPIAPVFGGNEALGAAFVSYLLSEDGQSVLSKYGFNPPRPPA